MKREGNHINRYKYKGDQDKLTVLIKAYSLTARGVFRCFRHC